MLRVLLLQTWLVFEVDLVDVLVDVLVEVLVVGLGVVHLVRASWSGWWCGRSCVSSWRRSLGGGVVGSCISSWLRLRGGGVVGSFISSPLRSP